MTVKADMNNHRKAREKYISESGVLAIINLWYEEQLRSSIQAI